jgi:flagellar protein FlaI
MADAQSVKLGNKELEKVKAREETADTLITNEAPSPAEGSSDISGMDNEKEQGEEEEDSLGSSHLLEKLAQIKISEQKLEKEFNSLILKGPASAGSGTSLGDEGVPVPEPGKKTGERKAAISSKEDELNILLPRSPGFGPAKRSFPDQKIKQDTVPEKDKEAQLKVKSILEEKVREEKIISSEDGKTGIEIVEEVAEEEKLGFIGKIKSLFKKIEVEIEPYEPQLHGPISEFKGVEGYEEIERYWVNEPYAFIVILYNEETNHHLYYVVEPELTDFEKVFLEEIKERLRDVLLVEDIDEDSCDKEAVLESKIWSIIQDYTLEITSPMLAKISYYIKRDFIRFGKIDALMCDTSIEDVSGNGHDVPIFLYHRAYQNIPTNLIYPEDELNSFIIQMAQRSGKHISVAEPIVDATMPDGSRIQMTLGTCVTAHGSTFTIRKFSETPITPVDLIKWGTFSAEAMAYLWLCIENNKSLIYAGGTASGKTSSLNAVSLFIPEKAKVITLEDTRELKLPHPNWIPSMTRDSFTADERGAVDMYDLLKAALRQRPEYLLVGEVRGKEALTLFQAMSTGHTTFSTMHADSVASAIHRLENPPISVPRSMIQALDIMSIQSQTYTKGKRVRRNIKLVEIIDIDPNTRNIRTNDIFVWDSESDVFVRTGESKALFDIKMRRGWGQGRIDEELYYRQKILEYMVNNAITDFNEISGIINAYQSRPERVLKKLQIV